MGWINLGKLFNLFQPQFLYLSNEYHNTIIGSQTRALQGMIWSRQGQDNSKKIRKLPWLPSYMTLLSPALPQPCPKSASIHPQKTSISLTREATVWLTEASSIPSISLPTWHFTLSLPLPYKVKVNTIPLKKSSCFLNFTLLQDSRHTNNENSQDVLKQSGEAAEAMQGRHDAKVRPPWVIVLEEGGPPRRAGLLELFPFLWLGLFKMCIGPR